jgi:hypothetical protein
MEIDMLIVTNTTGIIENTEVTMTRAELIEMIADGCFNREPIATIFEISGSNVFDITQTIAHAIWWELNADNRAPHHELEVWLNHFDLDCTGFGETKDIRHFYGQ